MKDMDEMFFQQVDKTSSLKGCWLWTGFIHPTGYVYFWYKGSCVKGHRYVYELYEGPIPNGYDVHHICEVKICVNPSHLEALPRKEHAKQHSVMYSETSWQIKKTHCPQGHEYTPENTYLRYNKRYCSKCRGLRIRGLL